MTDHQKKNWKSYCSEPLELVENYQQAKADNFAGWCIHHRLEIQPDGTRVSAQELNYQGLYYDRPASELIFMRFRDHSSLHSAGNAYMKGKHLSEETRQKMSVNNGRFWKGKHHSAETRKKIATANKGRHHSAEARQKIAVAKRGENNPLFGKHHSDETRLKMSKAAKGKHLWNNGVSCKLARECPGEGWTRGRLRFK